MSAEAVGLAATALLVANEVSSGDGKQLLGLLSGKTASTDHAAVVRLGMMMAGVVVLAVAASQSSPWPGVATAILVGLWALWAIRTFGQAQAQPSTTSAQQGTVLA
jgi:hypothetical protein